MLARFQDEHEALLALTLRVAGDMRTAERAIDDARELMLRQAIKTPHCCQSLKQSQESCPPMGICADRLSHKPSSQYGSLYEFES